MFDGEGAIGGDVRSVLVFGGSFDPPHAGHVRFAARARAALGLEWLVCVPAARSPHKEVGPVASGEDRVAMLGLAFVDVARVLVSRVEIDRAEAEEASYTVETLREIRALLGDGVRMRLLIGADQAASFHRWREARSIIEMAEPAVVLREPWAALDGLLEAMVPHWDADELEAWRGRVIDVEPMEVSSTEVRGLLRARGTDGWGAARSRLVEVVGEEVLWYVEREELYLG